MFHRKMRTMRGISCANCLKTILEQDSVDLSNEIPLEDGQTWTVEQVMSAVFPALGKLVSKNIHLKLCTNCVSNIVSSYKYRRQFVTCCHSDSLFSSVIRLLPARDCHTVNDDDRRNIKPNVEALGHPFDYHHDDMLSLSPQSPVHSESLVSENASIASQRNLGVQVRVKRLNLDAVDLPVRQIEKVKCQLMEANEIARKPLQSWRTRKLSMNNLSKDCIDDGDELKEGNGSREEDGKQDYSIISKDNNDDEITKVFRKRKVRNKPTTTVGNHPIKRRKTAPRPLSSITVKNRKDQTAVLMRCVYPGCSREGHGMTRLLWMMNHVHSEHTERCCFICHVCQQPLVSTKSILNSHFESAHPGHSFNLCKSCGLTFAEESDLNGHSCQETLATKKSNDCERNEYDDLACQCYLCEECFQDFTDLKEHMYNEHDEEMSALAMIGVVRRKKLYDSNESNPCSICNKFFKDKRNRDVHFKKEHGDPMNPKKYKCGFEDCGKFYLHRMSLRAHICYEHRQTGAFICNGCALSFPDKTTIAGHVCSGYYDHERGSNQAIIQRSQLNPTAPAKRIKCSFSDECTDTFSRRDAMRVHVARFHLGKKKEPHLICEVCGKAFVLKNLLDQHRFKAHQQMQNCPECQVTLNGSVQLRNHMKMHRDPQHLKYTCDLCPMAFRKPYFLKYHVHRVHNEKSTSISCPLCERVVKVPDSMYIHLRRKHPGPEGEAHETSLRLQQKAQNITKPDSAIISSSQTVQQKLSRVSTSTYNTYKLKVSLKKKT